MDFLYGAGKVRLDFLKCVNMLAKRVTRWTLGCDRALHRLVCYMQCSKNMILCGHVGDGADKLELQQFTDADLAGDRPSYRSTSGVVLMVRWPTPKSPLAALSKRQTSVSHSTTEGEIVAAKRDIKINIRVNMEMEIS